MNRSRGSIVVSVKDVAVAAGVSVGTVSNVLNHPDKVSAATVERVQQVIEELGFVRNDAARQLRAGRSRSIGLVVLDVGNPFFAEVARGAEERAAEEGLVVLLGGADQDPRRETAYLDLFREQRVLGVLITPVAADVTALRRLDRSGIPVILVDREMPGEAFRSVSVDDVEGGYLAVAHLLALGRRRIAVVAGPPSIPQVADRIDGARRAVAEHPDASLEVIEADALTVLAGRDAGERICAAAVRPDAVFAVNDLLAVGVLQALALAGSGVRVPDDVALIGYDDIDFAASTVVPLSSIRQPARALGSTAVELLLAGEGAAAGERTIRYHPELVVRESTIGSPAD
ncbi:LacI family DNA-binding transcriptional regulator [Microbacterium sp. 22242]|uniref:LacI family DNA-binding transcriptional regulator n=1 Tax=Microbacterium sp. 22242 TaxID=3453896 RepID=UPI003F867F2B